MVIATEFLDPFEDDIVALPIDASRSDEWYANIIELIVGAVIFLTVVAIYNAIFSIWERLFRQSNLNGGRRPGDLDENQDDVIVRVTYALFILVIAYLIVRWLGPPRPGKLLRRMKPSRGV